MIVIQHQFFGFVFYMTLNYETHQEINKIFYSYNHLNVITNTIELFQNIVFISI